MWCCSALCSCPCMLCSQMKTKKKIARSIRLWCNCSFYAYVRNYLSTCCCAAVIHWHLVTFQASPIQRCDQLWLLPPFNFKPGRPPPAGVCAVVRLAGVASFARRLLGPHQSEIITQRRDLEISQSATATARAGCARRGVRRSAANGNNTIQSYRTDVVTVLLE